jgi:hypothetical protein
MVKSAPPTTSAGGYSEKGRQTWTPDRSDSGLKEFLESSSLFFGHLSDIAQRERARKEIVITGASGIDPQVKGEIEEGQS